MCLTHLFRKADEMSRNRSGSSGWSHGSQGNHATIHQGGSRSRSPSSGGLSGCAEGGHHTMDSCSTSLSHGQCQKGFHDSMVSLRDDPFHIELSFLANNGLEIFKTDLQFMEVGEWLYIRDFPEEMNKLVKKLKENEFLLKDPQDSVHKLKVNHKGISSQRENGSEKVKCCLKKIFTSITERLDKRVMQVNKDFNHKPLLETDLLKNHLTLVHRLDASRIVVVTEERNKEYVFAEFEKLMNEMSTQSPSYKGSTYDYAVYERVKLSYFELNFLLRAPEAYSYLETKLDYLGFKIQLNEETCTLLVQVNNTNQYNVQSLQEIFHSYIITNIISAPYGLSLFTVGEINSFFQRKVGMEHAKFHVFSEKDSDRWVIVSTAIDASATELHLLRLMTDVTVKTLTVQKEEHLKAMQTLVSTISKRDLIKIRAIDGQKLEIVGTSTAMCMFENMLRDAETQQGEFPLTGTKLKLLRTSEEAKRFVYDSLEHSGYKIEIDLENKVIRFKVHDNHRNRDFGALLDSLIKTCTISLKDYQALDTAELLMEVIEAQTGKHQRKIVTIVTSDTSDTTAPTVEVTGTVDIFQGVQALLEEMKTLYSTHEIFLPLSWQQIRFIETQNADDMREVTHNRFLKVAWTKEERYGSPGLSIQGARVGVDKLEALVSRLSSHHEQNTKSIALSEFQQVLLKTRPCSKQYVKQWFEDRECFIEYMQDCKTFTVLPGTTKAEELLSDCIKTKLYDVTDVADGTQKQVKQIVSASEMHDKSVIKEDGTRKLRIICTDDIFQKVDALVKQILHDYKRTEKCFLFEEDRYSLLCKALKELEDKYPKEWVTITLKQKQVLIKGARVHVEKCFQDVEELTDQLQPVSDQSRQEPPKMKQVEIVTSHHIRTALEENRHLNRYLLDRFEEEGYAFTLLPDCKIHLYAGSQTALNKSKTLFESLLYEHTVSFKEEPVLQMLSLEEIQKHLMSGEKTQDNKLWMQIDKTNSCLAIVCAKDCVPELEALKGMYTCQTIDISDKKLGAAADIETIENELFKAEPRLKGIVKLSLTENELTFVTSPDAVDVVQTKLNLLIERVEAVSEIERSLPKTTIQLEPDKLELLQKLEVMDYIESKFREFHFEIDTENQRVVIYAMRKLHLDAAEQSLIGCLKEKTIDVSDILQTKKCEPDELQKKTLQCLDHLYEGKILVKMNKSKKSLKLLCTDDIEDAVLSKFEEIRRCSSEVTVEMTVEIEQMNYLKRFCQDALGKVEGSEVTLHFNSTNRKLELTGQGPDVDQCKRYLQGLVNDIILSMYSLDGDCAVLQTEEGQSLVKRVENQKPCVISINQTSNDMTQFEEDAEKNCMSSSLQIPGTSSTIVIKHGTIKDHGADVLVIPVVNGEIPVEIARSTKGQFVNKLKEKLDCFKTDAKQAIVRVNPVSGLSYKSVVLCRMPQNVKQAANKEKDMIRTTVKNVLLTTGPYDNKPVSSALLCLYFPQRDNDVNKIMKHSIKGSVEACRALERHKIQVSLLVHKTDFADVKKQVSSAISSTPGKGLFQSKKKAKDENTRLQIKLHVGPLEKFKVDVIVNSVDSSLDFIHGAVSNSLNMATNGKLKDECRKKVQRQLSVAEVASTDGCGLPSKKVYHGNLNLYQSPAAETDRYWEEMKIFMIRCLEKMQKHKLKTIAFPVLGAGKLNYPLKELVPFMFDVVEKFSFDDPASGIATVYFVLHPGDQEIVTLFHSEWMARNYYINRFGNLGVCPGGATIDCGDVMIQVIESQLSFCQGESDGLICLWTPEQLKEKRQHPVVGDILEELEFHKFEKQLTAENCTLTLGGSLPATRIIHVLVKEHDTTKAFILGFQKAREYIFRTVQIPVDCYDKYSYPPIIADSVWRGLDEMTSRTTKVLSSVSQAVSKQLPKCPCVVTLLVKDSNYRGELVRKLGELATTQTSKDSTSWFNRVTNIFQGWVGGTAETEGKYETEQAEMNTSRCCIAAESAAVCDEAHELIMKEMKQLQAKPVGSSVDGGYQPKNEKILAWRGEVYQLPIGKDDEWRQKFDRTKLQDIVSSYTEAGQFYLIGDLENISIAYKELTQEYEDDALQPAATEHHTQQEIKREGEPVSVKMDHYRAAEYFIGHDVLLKWCQVENDEKNPGYLKVFFTSLENSVEAQNVQQRIKGVIQEELPVPESDWNRGTAAAADAMRGTNDVFLKYWEDKHVMLVFAEDWDNMAKAKKRVQMEFGHTKITSRRERKFAASTTVTVGQQKSVDVNDPDQKTVKGKLLTVKVYKQDITKLPVDVVVNAANENLSHGGGVARIIAKVAGNKLIEESNEIVRNTAIPVSQLAVTTGGSLPCRRVFHAVGPRWHDYGSKNKCLEDLSNTILRCLCEARNRGYSSIAFPSISAAIFAVPEELCGKMYVQALKSFDHVVEGGSLKEVHFVDITDKMVDIIQKELERNWDLPQDTETLRKDTAFINRNLGSSEAFALTSHDGQYKQTTKPATSTLADAFFNFSENISISIFYQDIFSTKTEVFVSWEDICLHSRKPLVTALKKQAGDQYRADRNKHYSAKLGDIIETPGWKLNQSRIIHAVVGSSAKEEDFNVTLRNVLGQCVKMNCSSVLLPVYNHIYSSVQGKNKSALFIEIVVDALSDLSRHKNKPSLCVYVVDKQQSVITELCRVFHKYLVSAGHTQVMTTQVDKTKEPQKEADGNGCSICLDSITQPSRLKCGHVFCKGCIDDAFKVKKACPVCKVVCGMITGNMPPGDMSDYLEHSSLPGHSGTATIVITYSFKDGIQTSEHPHPGKKYLGTNRTAYLPDTPEGRKVLDLLKEAWYRRLTFTVGQSVTIGGHYDRVTWNEIHHKTSKSGGSTKHGYPDHGYLKRVQEELAAQGVVEAKDMDTSL